MRPAKRVRITITKGMARFLDFRNLGDHRRGQARANAARRLIVLWETIRQWKTWTPLRVLAPDSRGSERRWVRRNLYTLKNAGLVEIRPGIHVRARIEFRVKEKPL